MHASARALLDQIIDYAGLFPPAKLPLEDALRHYLRYRRESPHRWMLGRFVCPTGRLQELLALAKSHSHASLLSLTTLGQQGSDISDLFARLEDDIVAIQAFRSAWGNDDVIDMIEVPLPKGDDANTVAVHLGYANAVAYHLQYAVERLAQAGLKGFFEIPVSAQWREGIEAVGKGVPETHDWREGVARITQGFPAVHGLGEPSHLGLKLRCGGVTADAFPSDADIAFFIDRCRAARLAWKATAGLHHPRRHWDASLLVWHHGFLNLFIAGLLAQIHPLSEADIVAILADRDGRHFHFEADAIGWKAWSCATQQIAELRATSATTFGSCSFDEPCADLVAMGLLDVSG